MSSSSKSVRPSATCRYEGHQPVYCPGLPGLVVASEGVSQAVVVQVQHGLKAQPANKHSPSDGAACTAAATMPTAAQEGSVLPASFLLPHTGCCGRKQLDKCCARPQSTRTSAQPPASHRAAWSPRQGACPLHLYQGKKWVGASVVMGRTQMSYSNLGVGCRHTSLAPAADAGPGYTQPRVNSSLQQHTPTLH